MVENPPAMWETWVRSLGWEDPLEKERLPTPVFWPGEFHGLCSPWGHKDSDTTERLSLLWEQFETTTEIRVFHIAALDNRLIIVIRVGLLQLYENSNNNGSLSIYYEPGTQLYVPHIHLLTNSHIYVIIIQETEAQKEWLEYRKVLWS